MRREIRFRAWDKKNKAMVSWEQLLKHCDRLSVLSLPAYEIMQYIGLKDKNGKEIFEGDRFLFDPDWECVCLFHNGSFGWEEDGEFYDLRLVYSSTEVIGNIFQNPEILCGNVAESSS